MGEPEPPKRPRRAGDSGYATPAGGEDEDLASEGKVDERFLELVRQSLSEDIQNTAKEAIRDVAAQAATAAVDSHFKKVQTAMAAAIAKQDKTYQEQFAAQAAQVATVSSNLTLLEKDHEDLKAQVQDLSHRLAIAEKPSAATRSEIQQALRDLSPKEADPTIIRFNTADFVSHAEARALCTRLARAAKVAESRLTTMGSSISKNLTIKLDGTPASAAAACKSILKQCKDDDGKWKELVVNNPDGPVRAYLSEDVPEATRAPQMLSKRMYKELLHRLPDHAKDLLYVKKSSSIFWKTVWIAQGRWYDSSGKARLWVNDPQLARTPVPKDTMDAAVAACRSSSAASQASSSAPPGWSMHSI